MKFIGISKLLHFEFYYCTYKIVAEQKARTTYDNILSMVKDCEVADPIKFLRKREIIHFQRFGEALRMITEDMDKKNFYAYNPSSCVKNK